MNALTSPVPPVTDEGAWATGGIRIASPCGSIALTRTAATASAESTSAPTTTSPKASATTSETGCARGTAGIPTRTHSRSTRSESSWAILAARPHPAEIAPFRRSHVVLGSLKTLAESAIDQKRFRSVLSARGGSGCGGRQHGCVDLRVNLIRLIGCGYCATARPGRNPRLQFKRPLRGGGATGLELTSRVLETKDADFHRVRALRKACDLILAILVGAGDDLLVALRDRHGCTRDHLSTGFNEAGVGE